MGWMGGRALGKHRGRLCLLTTWHTTHSLTWLLCLIHYQENTVQVKPLIGSHLYCILSLVQAKAAGSKGLKGLGNRLRPSWRDFHKSYGTREAFHAPGIRRWGEWSNSQRRQGQALGSGRNTRERTTVHMVKISTTHGHKVGYRWTVPVH